MGQKEGVHLKWSLGREDSDMLRRWMRAGLEVYYWHVNEQ
jgi:hypothetical protein